MSATPIDQIPEPVRDSVKATADYGVPCGCRWNLAFTGVYLCNYHDGMTDGYHLAQEGARSAPRHVLSIGRVVNLSGGRARDVVTGTCSCGGWTWTSRYPGGEQAIRTAHTRHAEADQ